MDHKTSTVLAKPTLDQISFECARIMRVNFILNSVLVFIIVVGLILIPLVLQAGQYFLCGLFIWLFLFTCWRVLTESNRCYKILNSALPIDVQFNVREKNSSK